MNIQDNSTGSGSVSWFRAYHVGQLIPDAPAFLVSGLAGSQLEPLALDRRRFFDIQVMGSRQVARARYQPEIAMSGRAVRGPGAAGTAGFSGRVRVHVLAHVSGFVCLRATVKLSELQPQPAGYWLLHHLERGPWDGQLGLEFTVPGLDRPLTGNARTLFNWVFLDLFSRWAGRTADPGLQARQAAEGPLGCDQLHELTRAGQLQFPYPVSFGTQFEIGEPRLASLQSQQAAALAAHIAGGILRGPYARQGAQPTDIEHDADSVWWYVEENQALTLTPGTTADEKLDVIDTDRTQLMEYLTLRRGALRSVQRETQRVISAGSTISKGRIETWHHILATTTDDYVLDDGIGQLVKLLRAHNAADRRLRDLALLEAQVRENLGSFQQRLETAGAWVSSVVGALVGAGALVIGLNSVTLSALSRLLGVSVSQLPDRHAALLSAVTVGLLVAGFAAAYVIIRRASQRLQTGLAPRQARWRRAGQLLRPARRRR